MQLISIKYLVFHYIDIQNINFTFQTNFIITQLAMFYLLLRFDPQQLTTHLNTIDTTGNIKFTYEEESEGSLPFFDTLRVRKEDGTIKLLVYRKKTHTDQYLNFSSHHPLHQKLGVIKTLLDRCNNIVTDPENRRKEEEYTSKALQEFGYPKWTIRKIR